MDYNKSQNEEISNKKAETKIYDNYERNLPEDIEVDESESENLPQTHFESHFGGSQEENSVEWK